MAAATRTILLRAGWVLLGVLGLIVLLGWFMVDTRVGTRWSLQLARSFLPGELLIEQTSGNLAGPLVLENLRYRDPRAGIDVRVERLSLDLQVTSLLRVEVHVADLELQGVDVWLGEGSAEAQAPSSEPFTLEAPIDVRIDRLRVADAVIGRDRETLFTIDTAALAGTWIGTAVEIEQFDLQAPQGQIHLQGAAQGGDPYLGSAQGRFRWQVADRTYAGRLEVDAGAPTVNMIARLSSPATATLQVELMQRAALPWTLRLDVPRFDPRGALLQGDAVHSLAASLHGKGDRTQASVGGTVMLNDESLQIERLEVQQQDRIVTMSALLRPPQGNLQLDGTLSLQQPATVQASLDWDRVVLPAAWVGQELQTEGQLEAEGSTERFRSVGSMRLGPPQRVASIDFDVSGTPQQIELQQFDVVQEEGRLRVRGQVDLQPLVAWQLSADADSFDPGEFFVAWPGNLAFDLETQGRLPEAGPQAQLQLASLSGELRGQSLRGQADLELTSNRVISGTLDLRAGENRLRFRGKPGERIDALVRIDAPALGALAAPLHGELHGQISATGLWPQIRSTGELRAQSLQVATLQAERLQVEFEVDEPLDPRGRIDLAGKSLAVGGLNFATLTLNANGSASEHALQLEADGDRLAGQLALRGSRIGTDQQPGWSGRIERLVLDVVDTTRLTLQKPVEVRYAPPQMRLSRACLAGTDLQLCVAGEGDPGGAFDVQYSLRNLPLALANSLMPTFPAMLDGTLEGEGRLQRNAEGRLDGRADLTSAHGEIAQTLASAPDTRQVLLSYDDLRVSVELRDRQASGSVGARLNEEGQLRGELALSEVGTDAAAMQGRLTANLPSISVLEVFVPQLANLRGELQVNARASGPLDAPDISGEARLAALAADVPMLGLALREGSVQITPQANDTFGIEGSIRSGEGTLRVTGTAATSGRVEAQIEGKQFLAADIPAARVLIEPQLQFAREEERMTLSGKLHIPSASINVQKLPRGQSTQDISEDVVVIDAKTREEAQQEAIPLHATVDVSLGDDVTLTGFGLDATVDGQLQVREAPGQPTTGSGQVRVSGTYQAYGQDLTIRQGQLLYAGTPLDNPRLSIVAVRDVDPLIAGLRIEGPAQNPQLTVFSEPATSQSNALSYLVTGKPMDEIGEGEGDAVQSAARALGTAAGGLLAKNVGRRLGVDELGIQDSDAIGGAALTIGQYLSPRLYLSYGVGLFEPGEVVTLRYKLSDQVTVEALNGPSDSRAGIEYRVEK